jgi:predicted amidohydrolase
MARVIRIGAAQMGPIQRSDPRGDVVEILIEHLQRAKSEGCDLVVFPELALTTFFPRWVMHDANEINAYFEASMPSAETQPLFDFARENKIGFYLGYAELADEDAGTRHFNTAILVDKSGEIVSKYRKIHLPGHSEPDLKRKHQHLEKRYFEVGDLGFPVCYAFAGNVGMALCNDRRWPETFRVLGMQNVELTLVGYNTPTTDSLSDEQPDLRRFHSRVTMQAGAYQNSTWVVGVAKAGVEDNHPLMGGTCIIAPTGEVVAEATSDGAELVVADCDLDRCDYYKTHIFNFAAHRRPEAYGVIVESAGPVRDPKSEKSGAVK